MNAKRFFYLCAGLLVLAAVQQLTARRANAQGPQLVLVQQWSYCIYAIDNTGRVYSRQHDEPTHAWHAVGQLPSGTPAFISRQVGGDVLPGPLIGMTNGDVWLMTGFINGSVCGDDYWTGVQFTYYGNIFGNVQLEGKTWSGVKDGYRR